MADEDIFEGLNGEVEEGDFADENMDNENDIKDGNLDDINPEKKQVEPRSPLMEEEDDEDDTEIEIIDDVEEEEKEEKPKPKKRKENYSARVRKRIEREKRVTEAERQRAEKLQRELDYTNQQLNAMRQQGLDGRIEDIDSKIESVKERLSDAIEKGETEEQVAQQDRLATLRARKIQAQRDKENFQPVQVETRRKTGTKAEEWIFKQSSWYNKDREATEAANIIDSSLTKEGYDQNTDEYFEELNRRLSRRFPNLVKSGDNDDEDDFDDEDFEEKPEPKKKSKPVSARVEQIPASAKKKRSGNKIQLTRSDLANMEKFGLDPTDPKALKEYAKNKL